MLYVESKRTTSVIITDGYVNDATQIEPLIKDTSRNFSIREFSADKGYLSKKALDIIHDLGGTAYIIFKSPIP